MTSRSMRAAIAFLAASVLSAALSTTLSLPASVLPVVFLPLLIGGFAVTGRLEPGEARAPLRRAEWLIIAIAGALGLVRLATYGSQYTSGHLIGAVTWDDHWHFQEVASLVTSQHFPPRLNFQPESNLHFYYIPWIGAAALSSAFMAIGLDPMVKLTYGLDALILAVLAALALVLVVRHTVSGSARSWALVALVVAGAVVDGGFAVVYLVLRHIPAHAEWWQNQLGIENQFSSLSTLAIWVPHHLASAAAFLLAAVVATDPQTLRPRRSLLAYAVAGVLLACSLFSSIFVFIGGAVAFAPLLVRMARDQWRGVALLMVVLGFLSLPLLNLYTDSGSSAGFKIGQPFTSWSERFDVPVAGVLGTFVALALMILEVGWMFVVGILLLHRRRELASDPLFAPAVTSFCFLCSTSVVSFSGANNWAMRGSIVPMVVLACFAGRALSPYALSAREAMYSVARERSLNRRVGAALMLCVLIASVLAHVNEWTVLGRASAAALRFEEETEACKNQIMALNEGVGRVPDEALPDCKDKSSLYHLERQFLKTELSEPDRELMGKP